MKHTKNNALADIEATDMLKDELYGGWSMTNDDTRNIAIRCVDRLVLEGYVKDCVDTNDTTEFSVQDIIHEEINKALKVSEDDDDIRDCDIENVLESLDDGICNVMDKHIAKDFVSDNGYFFFEDRLLEEKFSLAVDMLKELIEHTHKKDVKFCENCGKSEYAHLNGVGATHCDRFVGDTKIYSEEDTCPKCDQHPYSDIDDMCPVCGQSTSKTIEICPIPTEVGTVRISLVDDEKDAILNKEVSLDFPFTINGNELWVFEGDENKAKTNLGIN